MVKVNLELRTIVLPSEASRLTAGFFARDAEVVARELLGKTIVRILGQERIIYGTLQEIAAYEGKVISTYKGVEYAPGSIGISTKFGKHLIDISTGKIDEASCITLRGAELYLDGQIQKVNGPGNLSQALEIGKEWDGLSIDNPDFWIGGQSASAGILQRKTSGQPSNCVGIYYIK